MNEIFRKIVVDVHEERERQKDIYSPEDDAMNTVNDWARHISRYLCKATDPRVDSDESMYQTFEYQRNNLVKVAALAMAALEILYCQGSFAPRYYDDYNFGEDLSIPPSDDLDEVDDDFEFDDVPEEPEEPEDDDSD